MRLIFGVMALLIVLAAIGMLSKTQLSALGLAGRTQQRAQQLGAETRQVTDAVMGRARDGAATVAVQLRSNKDLRHGLSHILVETGEPSLAAVLAAFPAGTYELSGRTLEGRRFETQLELTHALPAAPEIFFPADGDEDIPVEGLVIQWRPDPAVSSWLVELEREDDLPGKIVVILPGKTSQFAVPAGFLQSGVEYQVGVRASSAQGNVSVSELVFVTL